MIKKFLIFSLFALNLSGCSVFMAATGSGDYDPSVIRVGADRRVIESELGRPISYVRRYSGDVATYRILTGDKGDYRRAAAYAVLDGLTLGFAELVSFPTEALQGDMTVYEIVYDRKGKAKKIDSNFRPAPAPNPSDIVEEKWEEYNKGEGA